MLDRIDSLDYLPRGRTTVWCQQPTKLRLPGRDYLAQFRLAEMKRTVGVVSRGSGSGYVPFVRTAGTATLAQQIPQRVPSSIVQGTRPVNRVLRNLQRRGATNIGDYRCDVSHFIIRSRSRLDDVSR
jgi:hypothetical protein